MYQVPLEMICRHDRTAEVCRAAVEEDGWQLENVPEEMKTPELCRKALETEAGFGNDFHRGLVQHIPSPEVCMEVLKECRENNPEELYGVAVAIRPEVMNGEMADFLLPLDGRCISILPVHLQTPERVRVAVETSGMSAVGRGGVPKSLLTPDVYVRCAAHSRESLMMIPWAERSPEVCLMAKTLYPDWVKNHPEFVPESVHNQDSVYTLNSLMESLTGEKFSYRQMTDFYNGKPLNVKRMETPDGVQKDKSVKFDKENKAGISNLLTIYCAATGKTLQEAEAEFEGQGYGVFKPAVGEAVVELLRPIREESQRIMDDKAYLESVYQDGAERARRLALKTLSKVQRKVGFVAAK